MGINAVPGKGVSRARVVCDECGRDDVVTCDYERKSGGEWVPNAGQVKRKLSQSGWADVKGKLLCQTCETKRKVFQMKSSKTTKGPEGPSKKQRLEIISMLMEVYDLDAERYANGDTDNTVADVLGVMPGWVAQIREAEFGPDGGNQDMESLKTALEAAEKEISGIAKSARDVADAAEKGLSKISGMRAELDKIRQAVGKHVEKKAGVA